MTISAENSEYVAILRCRTWNVWPEKSVVEESNFQIKRPDHPDIPARLAIVSYLNRTKPEVYLNEETAIGPLVWSGDAPGFHLVGDSILKAPEDVVDFSFQHRNSQRGEIDICVNFKYTGEIPSSVLEALKTLTASIMSLLNLRLGDFLLPTAPFQLRKVIPGGGAIESSVLLSVRNRKVIEKQWLEDEIHGVAKALLSSPNGEKLRVALELYAAHFNERQARVRFLLLIMAIEALAKSTSKHKAVLDWMGRWRDEIVSEKSKYDSSSEEFKDFSSLERELGFRAEDSIRTQIRKLFQGIGGQSEAEQRNLARRVLSVYDKRSALVHDGYLPLEELSGLESEAWELLEMLFVALT